MMTNRNQFQAFPFHLVDPSPWPLLTSFALLTMALGAVMSFHGFTNGGYLLSLGFILTLSGMILWFRDVIIEGTYMGNHTSQVQKGLTIGVALFIVSEIFAFLSIFWAFFHSSLAPTIEIGSSWPPFGIEALDPFAIPLLNTILLLSSGKICLTWDLDYIHLASITLLPFNLPRTPSIKRIGPHNFDILSILICSLLGDGHASKDPRGNGTVFRFYYGTVNMEYALYLHKIISKLGYCSLSIPEARTRTIKNYNYSDGNIIPAPSDKTTRGIIRFNTYTYSSFNWIHDSFYLNNIKRVPEFIGDYLTPQGLAHWIMDDGNYIRDRGLRISTHSFTYKEVSFLSELLTNKYGLKTSLHSGKIENTHVIYISKKSLPDLIEIVRPFMLNSMLYKLGL